MAKAYLIAVGEATGTWQDGILFLLKSANDKQRAEAMTAATKVAADYDDETASSNLKKRISEARRVFKAADTKGTPDVIKLFEGKGSWHQKVAKLPKASTKGRKKNQGAGKTTKADQRTALVKVLGEETVKTLPKKDLGQRGLLRREGAGQGGTRGQGGQGSSQAWQVGCRWRCRSRARHVIR
jgi:hypothetical protein